jgi:dihydrolipoamide dehydrogenase
VKTPEVCVIGAGPGGYVAAIKAAQLGKKVLVIEREFIGGVCLNVGCIPSKALITAGHFYERLQHSSEMGINVSKASVDMKKLQEWKNEVCGKLTGGVAQLFKMNGIEHVMGEAKFLNPQELEVKTSDGKTESVKAANYIIANGSRPIEIPGFAFDEKNVLSSTGALAQKEIPKRLVVIGGGYIGLEIGSMYHNLGSEVTVIEASKGLLMGATDPDCARIVERRLNKRGVKVILNAKAKSFVKKGGDFVVTVDVDGKPQNIACDKIFVAVGRKPNSDQMNLSGIGLKVSQRGFIEVNKQMRTNVPHIFAIGDVAGQPMLAHKASREGIVAAEVISGKNAAMDVKVIPAVIFTDPEIASVGLTAEDAKAQGYDVAVGRFPYAANGRALSLSDADGFVKIIMDKKNGIVLGVHIVGVEATTMISEAALGIEMGATAEDIAATIHPHPTLPEMVMEAAESALGHPIHIYQRPASERPQRPATKSP